MATDLHRRPEPLGMLSATLPTCRVLLLFAGVLAIAESVALGAVLFALAALSFGATLSLAALIYRTRTNLAASDGADVRPS